MHRIEQAIEGAIRYRKHGILITETFDLARKQAEIAIKNGLSPFSVVIKDCFTLVDAPTTCASKMLETFDAPYTSTIVQRLIDKGGCIIGKANMDEYCMGTSSVLGHFGPVKSFEVDDNENDWFVSGGSSGGSAVAVMLRISDVGIGSDTGGSTRNPAALCGLFGFKPTYGVLSRHGLIPLVNSLDVPSVLARSALDCWKYLEMMCGKDNNDPTSRNLPTKGTVLQSLKGLRIGIPREFHNEFLSEDAFRAWNRAASLMKEFGAELVDISLPSTKYALSAYHVLATSDIASNMARYDGVRFGYRSQESTSTNDLYARSRTESLNGVVKRRILAGNYFLLKQQRSKYFERACKVRRLISEELDDAFSKSDLLLAPVASGVTSKFSKLYEGNYSREEKDDYFTVSANLAGVPSMSLPFGQEFDTENYIHLPLAVQLIGPKNSDALVCQASDRLYRHFCYLKHVEFSAWKYSLRNNVEKI